jgi:hypothetical protein
MTFWTIPDAAGYQPRGSFLLTVVLDQLVPTFRSLARARSEGFLDPQVQSGVELQS